jgi:hypothetical protein
VGHETDEVDLYRHVDRHEFLFCSGQAQERQLQHDYLPRVRQWTFAEGYPPPQKYYFAASKGLGLKLKKLLTKPKKLKEELRANWDKHCKTKITDTTQVPLTGKLREYFEKFDFSIFSTITVAEMIKGHASTVFYERRFGDASFPERPPIMPPPATVQPGESRYVQQLFEVYSEKLSMQLNGPAQLAKYPDLERHFNRSREVFYHAESLRNFPRDSVDPGAFDAIQDEIYHGCVDVYEMEDTNGMARILATVSHAGTLTPNCNALCVRVQTKDKARSVPSPCQRGSLYLGEEKCLKASRHSTARLKPACGP